MRALKDQPGGDMLLLGSSDLATTLADAGLIDEYRLMVVPTLLGSGKTLLKGAGTDVRLKLLGARTFGNGNVLLSYVPDLRVAGQARSEGQLERSTSSA